MSFHFLLTANPFSSLLYRPKMQDNLFSPAVNGSTTIEEFHVHFFSTSPLRIPRYHYKKHTHTHAFRRRNFHFTLVEFLPLLSPFPFLTTLFISMLLSLPLPLLFFTGEKVVESVREARKLKSSNGRERSTQVTLSKKNIGRDIEETFYTYIYLIYIYSIRDFTR